MINALCLGGPCDGKVVAVPPEWCDDPERVVHLGGLFYRLLNSPLWQGPNRIVGYATVLLPRDEPPPGNAVSRLYAAGCVRPAC